MRFLLLILILSFISAAWSQDCIQNSTLPSCAQYSYPNEWATSDVQSLCTDMDFMPGCTIDRTCTGSDRTDVKGSNYCKKFALLREVCAFDTGMSMMKGCKNYTSLCVPNSAVEQCTMNVLPIPSTMIAKNLTLGICNEMVMDGCEKCSASGKPCDWLAVYSNLCIQMPDMSQCTSWRKMCEYIPEWPLCSAEGGSSGSPVQMLMYFHTGFSDYILFKGWVPRNSWQYALSLIAVFVVSLLHEVLKLTRSILEKKWTKTYEKVDNCCDDNSLLERTPFRPFVDIPRSILSFVEVMWGLFVMLIAMTYNVGLFVAIGAGTLVGTLLFGRFMPYSPASGCCH